MNTAYGYLQILPIVLINRISKNSINFPQEHNSSRGLKDVTSLRRLIIRTTAIRVTFTENKTVKHVEDSYRGPMTVLKEIPQLPQGHDQK